MSTDLEHKRATQRAYDAARYADPVQREILKARSRAGYAKNRAARQAYGKQYNVANKAKRRAQSRRRLYGLSDAAMYSLSLAHEGRCGICVAAFTSDKLTHIDHCHTTGKVRGLLCQRCNTALGTFGDNLVGLQRAVDYLKESA